MLYMCGVIRSFQSRALKAYWEKSDASGLHGSVERISRILDALDAAAGPSDLDQPGWHFPELSGARHGTYSLRVTGNWRITFEWDGADVLRVDYEDYH